MRYINLSRIVLPDGWFEASAAATSAVSQGDSPDDHSGVWRQLKSALADLFNDKCWYCETAVPRSDNAVDHFRPKGRVSDAVNPHTGYKWLAFDQTNFRYACTFCNSRRKDVDGGTAGGKADRFPLLDESKRLYAPGALADEHPVLLDPCDISDWRLLGCKRENGQPCPAGGSVVDLKRAETSIAIYHLQHEPTCKLRHAEAVKLLLDIEEAKGHFVLSQSDPVQETAFKRVAKRILMAIDYSSPFSGDMRFLLGGERDQDHPWVQDLLMT
ncbi:hypothetical protein HL653_04305 [Sphingomonas sp. AP4-R1]|uniref:hypothetical protein n=1 Tax=Sphingomonas sp. AP4-R1 TaxID=2735134 RepID=UPI001493D666|nr:hypothetical protein [Sphingomonas sp. AP4-R1]QJU57112.1 hypothetical protein HL653_04305 [Sphingomonas sp. AP4-R1]